MTFYFETFDDGGTGISGTLGSASVTPSTSGLELGAASLTAAAPAGLNGSDRKKVGAVFGGDLHYLASSSALSSVSGTSTLTLCPTSLAVATGQMGIAFTQTGGTPPVTWDLRQDSTCDVVQGQTVCSSIDGGVFTAGPHAGTVTVVVLDSYDAYVTAEVAVTEAAPDGGAFPFPPPYAISTEELRKRHHLSTPAMTQRYMHRSTRPENSAQLMMLERARVKPRVEKPCTRPMPLAGATLPGRGATAPGGLEYRSGACNLTSPKVFSS